MAERGVTVDHATLNRWGVKDAPEVAKMAQKRITIDKGRYNGAGITEINKIFKRLRIPAKIDTVRSKYLNNRIEPDHRFIKRVTGPMLGFKCFASAAATLDGIDVARMIRKCQLGPRTCGFRQFAQTRRTNCVQRQAAAPSLWKFCDKTFFARRTQKKPPRAAGVFFTLLSAAS